MCVRHVSVSGALQFAVFRAVCCVLHRPASRVIHCSELWKKFFFFINIIYSAIQYTQQNSKKQIPKLGPEGQKTIHTGDLNSQQSNRRDSFAWKNHDGDPSAGSPTETLLRLLLPLDDTVWKSFQHISRTRDPTNSQSECLTKSSNR